MLLRGVLYLCGSDIISSAGARNETPIVGVGPTNTQELRSSTHANPRREHTQNSPSQTAQTRGIRYRNSEPTSFLRFLAHTKPRTFSVKPLGLPSFPDVQRFEHMWPIMSSRPIFWTKTVQTPVPWMETVHPTDSVRNTFPAPAHQPSLLCVPAP